MFKLKETEKSVKVVFGKDGSLRDAPQKRFKKAEFGSLKYAKVAATKYAQSLIDFSTHTKSLARVIKTIPSMAKDKISFHTDNVKNRTGVVGVYLEHSYNGERIPYAYTAHYTVNGHRVRQRFPFAKFETTEDAFQAAIAARILAINLNKALLQK